MKDSSEMMYTRRDYEFIINNTYQYTVHKGHEIIHYKLYIGTSSTQQRQDSRNSTQVNISLEKMIRAGVLGIQLLPRNSLKG